MDGDDPTVITSLLGANLSYTTPTSSSPNGTLVAFQNLVPALVECFTIIFLGYVAGRTQIIQPSQAKGLGHYVTYFALPAIVFKSLVEIKFDEVRVGIAYILKHKDSFGTCVNLKIFQKYFSL